jgi:hypothetical protein
MPMDFKDMKSLVKAATVHKFREPEPEETEEDFRAALANHVASIDLVESQEIRTGKGWNKFNDEENKDMLMRASMQAFEKRQRRG